MKHPIQPLEADKDKVLRFKSNKIVEHLLDNGPFNLNTIAMGDFTQEDHEQFAQLIGYSLGGFSDLSYVADETYDAASKMAEGKSEIESRNEYLREKLTSIKESSKAFVADLYNIHPDDLER